MEWWKRAPALILVVPLLLLSGLALGCRPGEAQEVKLGTLFDYTGSLADFGPPSAMAQTWRPSTSTTPGASWAGRRSP